MKRLTVLLGRSGTTVLALGLALFLVSLIPSTPTGSYSGHVSANGKAWQTLDGDTILTPQQTLHVTVTTNGTLNVYILEVTVQTIYEWILEHHSESIDPSNITYFDEYLDSNPGLIAWQGQTQDGNIDAEYVPTKIVNATSAVSNHSPDAASTDYTWSLLRNVAPFSRVRILSEITIPTGVVLTLPWLSDLLRAKKKTKRLTTLHLSSWSKNNLIISSLLHA
jgi:hypothetical protein